MEQPLKLLRDHADLRPAQLAPMLNLPEAEVGDGISAEQSPRVWIWWRPSKVHLMEETFQRLMFDITTFESLT